MPSPEFRNIGLDQELRREVPEFSPQHWEIGERVFSGLNNGVKAGLFWEIARDASVGTYLSLEEIVLRFKQLFQHTELLEAFALGRQTKEQVLQYCQDSLCNVGLLKSQLNHEGQAIGFGVTEDGVRFGIPAALLGLQWENQHNQSLYSIFGQTNSPSETRAPGNRARILNWLARHPANVREIDLCEALKTDRRTVTETMGALRNYGLIEYKAITPQTGKVPLEYEQNPNQDLGQAPYITDKPTLQDLIVSVITTNHIPTFSIANIACGLPEEVRQNWQEKYLRQGISLILSGLAEKGFLLRVDQFKGGMRQSDISLLPKGRSIILNLIWPILLIIAGQPISWVQKEVMDKARQNLTGYAQASAELYYPYSNSYKKRSRPQAMAKLIEALQQTDQPLTNHDLAEIARRSSRTISQLLQPHINGSDEVMLEVDGKHVMLKRIKTKGVTYYYDLHSASQVLDISKSSILAR